MAKATFRSERVPAVIYLFQAVGGAHYYVGKHAAPACRDWPRRGVGPLPDGYCGSGTRWAHVVRKYGKAALRWIILHRCDTEAEAYRLERDVYRPRLWRRYGWRTLLRVETSGEAAQVGRISGHLSAKRRIGIHAQTREELVTLGKLTQERALGIHGRSMEQMRDHGQSGRSPSRERSPPLSVAATPANVLGPSTLPCWRTHTRSPIRCRFSSLDQTPLPGVCLPRYGLRTNR